MLIELLIKNLVMFRSLGLSIIWCLSLSTILLGQLPQKPLTYYLPDESYNNQITSPEDFFGYSVGDWHLTPAQVVSYIQLLGQQSDRFTVETYAYSYEQRPVVLATVSSPENHKKIDEIKQAHHQLTDPASSSDVNIADQPIIVWMGYSVHGNEASGTNASVLFAYYLAASNSDDVHEWLNNAVILFDPIINPDGATRFAAHVNSFRSIQEVSDPESEENNEGWLSGRTNHYWFDLNRDWLLQQHPESRGRINKFQEWLPNVLTDHHEMGSNSSFFFMPGIPSRTNPLTPEKNQILTAMLGDFHAKELDEIGSLYYTKESFDDFYYGKGSTYPDLFGGVGILFEQGSSRGHARDTQNGVLRFPFTIRNQVETSFSTIKGSIAHRIEFLEYFRDYYTMVADEAKKASTKAYLLGGHDDFTRTVALLDVLHQHKVAIRPLTKNVEMQGKVFKANEAFVLLTEENHPRFLEAAFEERTSFTDSTFYDVSAWSLQHAFGVPLAKIGSRELRNLNYGDAIQSLPAKQGKMVESANPTPIGYVISWDEFESAKVLLRLQKAGLIMKVATEPFELNTADGLLPFDEGSILVPFAMQGMSEDDFKAHILQAIDGTNVIAYEAASGLTPSGIDLGSRGFEHYNHKKIAILVGNGVSTYEAGEVWHLFDQRLEHGITLLNTDRLTSSTAAFYDVIVMVNTYFFSKSQADALSNFVRGGGTLVATKGAVNQLQRFELAPIEQVDAVGDSTYPKFPEYSSYSRHRGGQVTGGSIFSAILDPTHPVAYGFKNQEIALFRNSNTVMKLHENPFGSPVRYTSNSLLAGYVSKENLERINGSAAINIYSSGRGKMIAMVDNPNFRAYWWSTNRLFINAVLFGDIIDSGTTR